MEIKLNPVIKKVQISDIKILNKISIESKLHWKYPLEWIEKWRKGFDGFSK